MIASCVASFLLRWPSYVRGSATSPHDLAWQDAQSVVQPNPHAGHWVYLDITNRSHHTGSIRLEYKGIITLPSVLDQVAALCNFLFDGRLVSSLVV